MRALRVALFVDKFPMISESFILRQIIGLIELGHEVTIFSAWRPDPDGMTHSEVAKFDLLQRTIYLDDLIPRDSGYWAMPVWPLTGQTWTPDSEKPVPNIRRIIRALPPCLGCAIAEPKLTLELLNPARYGDDALSLAAIFRCAVLRRWMHRFDVAHAHFGPVAKSFRFVRRLWKIPLIASFHGYDFCTFPRVHGCDTYRDLFQSADVITVGSKYSATRVRELGCPDSKLSDLSVAVPVDEIVFRERHLKSGDAIRVLSVGRLVEIKGHEYLLRAVAQLRPRYPNLRVNIIGEGPLRGRLEALVRDLGISDIAVLHGAQRTEFVLRMMNEADIFVLASVAVHGDAEGQGLVVQEAQATGLPVIVTNHGALPEGMVPNESGYVVEEGNANALAHALGELIEAHEDWPRLGRIGRDFVSSRFSTTLLNRQLVDLYALAVQRFTRPQE